MESVAMTKEDVSGWRKRQIMVEDDDDIQDYKKPWVGLTDEEFQYCVELKNPEAIIEEVEAKLKGKNL